MLDDEIFPNYEQLQIVEKLVKTCYMDGLTDDCVNEVIMKLTDDILEELLAKESERNCRKLSKYEIIVDEFDNIDLLVDKLFGDALQ